MEDNSEVEIELTLDNGFVCDFIPDFRLQKNTADHSSVSWRLPNSRTPINVEFLPSEFSDEVTDDPTPSNRSDV